VSQPANPEKHLVIMTANGKSGLGYQIEQLGDDSQKLHVLAYGSQALVKSQ